MPGRTVTRADLSEAVYQRVGLSRTESAALVESVLAEVCDCLAGRDREAVVVRFLHRARRGSVSANPKTGIEVPIDPRASWYSSRRTC